MGFGNNTKKSAAATLRDNTRRGTLAALPGRLRRLIIMLESNLVEGRVVENKHWTEHLYSLRVEAGDVPFTAGQFGKLALDIDGERIARPYSFVNAPHEPTLEFYSSIVPEGPLSPLLATLKSGDPVWVAGKGSGFLVLDEVPEGKYLWLLATGTALGPFLSILKTDVPWQRFERVVLVHSVRHAGELSYRDAIKQFEKEHSDRFTMIPFVSRERVGFAMHGRIPAAIEDGSLEKRGDIPFDDDAQVMVCGNPGMVKDSTAVLQARGLRKNRRRTPGHITVERYW